MRITVQQAKQATHSLILFLFLCGVSPRGTEAQFRSRCGTGVHVEERTGWIWLPQGRIFCPLVADPKAERSFVSYLRGDFATIANPAPDAKTNIGAVGLSASFAIFRVAGARPGDGIQLDLDGSVFSQFNLDAASYDMINADYLVGLPLTLRSAGFTTRLRVYHQSSHLGDEFLLSRQPERINLSFESVELILSQEAGFLRVYAGGETFFRREPDGLADRLGHAGAEIRPVVFGGGRLLAAIDVKAVRGQDGNWDPAWNARTGLEIARIPSPGHPPQVITFFVDYYDGVAPYGQFYREDIRYVGFGFELSR